MNNLPSPKVTILCDFDGTISPIDIADFIYRQFAGCGLLYSEQWAQGLISTREEILQTFATVNAGRAEISTALAGIPIDPTFPELVELARQRGLELAIVSDGLDWAIETILTQHNIHGLAVYANHVVFEGEKLTFEFPWFDPITPMSGVSKARIIQSYQKNGSQVIFIGDGRSDQDAVAHANLVFAKDDLARYCEEKGIPALVYTDFRQICLQIPTWLAGLK